MAKNKIISDRLNTFFTNNKMTVGESIPATGTWSKGDIVISTIQANGECGWICVEAGTPGRWKIFGAGGSLVTINASEIVNNSVTEVSLSGLGVSVSPSDKLLVQYNSTHLFEGVDFEIVEEGTKIRKIGGGSWNESNEPNTLFAFELLKVVKSIDGDKTHEPTWRKVLEEKVDTLETVNNTQEETIATISYELMMMQTTTATVELKVKGQSPKFNMIKGWYNKGFWTESMVTDAVEHKWLIQEEANEILGV